MSPTPNNDRIRAAFAHARALEPSDREIASVLARADLGTCSAPLPSRRRRLWLGGAAGLAALAVSGVAIGQGIIGSTDPGQRPIAQTQAIDPALSSRIAVFRRPRQAGDALPPWALQAIATRVGPVAGANPALSRSAQLGALGTLYLVPGNGQICAISAGFDGCGPASAFAAEGFGGMNHLATDATHTARFTGIVPDRVTSVTFTFATGPAVQAAVVDNAYGSILTKAPVAISYTITSGTVTRKLDQAVVQTLLNGPGALASFRHG